MLLHANAFSSLQILNLLTLSRSFALLFFELYSKYLEATYTAWMDARIKIEKHTIIIKKNLSLNFFLLMVTYLSKRLCFSSPVIGRNFSGGLKN